MKHSKLDKARALLVLNQPFFASILLPMPISEDAEIPTMATDGQSIKFNPAWVESLTLDETTFVLAHETLHCVFDHMGRRENRTPNRWNQAADYIINELLVNDRVGVMPKGGLLDPALTARGGNTADGVYRLLPESSEKKKSGDKGGALDHVNDAGTDNGKEGNGIQKDASKLKQGSEEIKVRVIQARNAARMQGKLSAGMERLVGELIKPRVDWKEVLRKFISKQAKVTATYARPKRRFLSEDIYLPSLSGEKLGKLVIAVDCSGSIYSNQKLLAEFSAEINAIKNDLMPESLEVIYFDSKVCRVDSIGEDDSLDIKPIGGGGTAFSPVIECINAMAESPVAVVFFTDLECSDWGNAPDYPVLWAVYGYLADTGKAPYGETVGVKSND